MEGNDMDMGIDGELEGQIEGGNHESSNVNSEGEQIQRIDSMASEDKLLSSYPYNNDSRNSSHEEPSVVHSQPKENDFNGSEGLKRKEKIAGGAEPSLRNVLSDPLTYMVRTLDSGECFRLQYHSLQKVGGQCLKVMVLGRLEVYFVDLVYISGARKRTCPGNGSTFVPMIDKKSRGGSSPKSREIVEGDDVKHDGSNPGNIQMELLHIIKKGMANLEKDIPWICFQRTWRRHRSIWRKGLRESSTLQELSIKLQELRSSLLLSFAGGMPDEEWEKQLNTARDSGNTDLLIILWRNFNDDVSKWMTAKAKRSQVHLNNRIEADEYADLQKLFPSLIIEGFSPAGVTAATAIAAAEAFAHDGPKNTDVLLKVPMKLIRQHNHHDLIILREALEREKRHISAKLAVLDSKERNLNDFGESEGSDQSMDKKPLVKFLKHDPHLMLSSISTPQGLEQGVDPMKSKSNKNMESG